VKAGQLVSRFVISRVIYTAFFVCCQDIFVALGAAFVDKAVGGAGGTRTPDPLLAKEVLSQLSYGPTELLAVSYQLLAIWWAMVDSNHRPRSYQDRALTS
jgi:hypothetical protein